MRWETKLKECKGEGEKYTVKWEWNRRHRKRDINKYDWIRCRADEENMQEIRGTKTRYWKLHARQKSKATEKKATSNAPEVRQQWSKKLMEGISEMQMDIGRLQQDLHSFGI